MQKVRYNIYSQILDCIDLELKGNGKFECKIAIKALSLGNSPRLTSFSDTTTAQNFNFN